MPAGRPSTYNPEICETLPQMFAEGQSVAEVCRDLSISRRTFYEWVSKHEEFSHAFENGLTLSQAWWEKQGRDGLFSIVEEEYNDEGKCIKRTRKAINAALWSMNMINRFKDDWKNRAALDVDASFAVSVSKVEKPTT